MAQGDEDCNVLSTSSRAASSGSATSGSSPTGAFGLLANRGHAAKLARCRALLAAVPPEAPAAAEPVAALMLRLTGLDITRCPVCHAGRLRVVAVFGPGQIPAPALDTP
jgi:hypothetical protein